MASVIDSGAAVCVPVNPFGWVYTRNCSQLNSAFTLNWGNKTYEYKPLAKEGAQTIDINLPASVVNRKLLSIATLIKPLTTAPIFVTGKAIFEMKDGSKKHMLGDRQLPISGGLLMFTTRNGSIPTNNIQKVTLKFSVPVEMGYVTSKTDERLAILWMGN